MSDFQATLRVLDQMSKTFEPAKPWLLYQFPERKKEIAALSYDQKMEWYSTREPREMVWLGNSDEFRRFWNWNVVMPLRIKRFYYRLKSFEIFKHYKHITEMKPKAKKYSV